MNRDLFALHDSDPTKQEEEGMFMVTPEKALELNKKGYGIHWTINDFGGRRRKRDNLTNINSWYFEIDEMPKSKQLHLINQGLIPSLIVESKNGFHVYFNCRTANWCNPYERIQQRLVEFYQADPHCKHAITKTARAPGYDHLKDPSDPFPVNVVWEYPVSYTAEQMAYFYPPSAEELKEKGEKPREKKQDTHGDKLADRVYNFNCIEALTRLSGSAWVANESYTFKHTGNNRFNIIVNGKSSAAFVDEHGRIGSSSQGGPTIWQWLKWFGHNDKTILEVLKQYLPELFT